jgi:hypothetical protein
MAARRQADGDIALLIDAGAARTPHPSGTLLEHLCGTRDLLARWGCSESLCVAGLHHSVYGTGVFQTATLPLAERERVRAHIGAAAERLVYLYGVMVRPSLYENLRRGSPYHVIDRATSRALALGGVEELADLLTLDLANRLQQLPRVPRSLWRMERDRRVYECAVPFLPAAAVAELRRVYRRRPVVVVALDAMLRAARRVAGRSRRPAR